MVDIREGALVTRRRFTVDEYYRMAEAGILHADDRVELIAGEIVQMSPIGSPHAACVDRFTRVFGLQLGDRVILRVQGPVRLSPDSEPEPDIALLRPRPDFYAAGHPGPADVYLIVEVADTTLRYDRDVKVPLYAAAGIPEVWIADLTGDAVRAFREPGPDAYRQAAVYRRGDALVPVAFPQLSIRVEEILG